MSQPARSASCVEAPRGGLADEYLPRETPPWWTEQAAVILRKLGDAEGELAVLDRWLARAGDPARWVGTMQARLVDRRHAVAERLRGSVNGEAHAPRR